MKASLIWALLAKDLLRIRRKPGPVLIQIALPLFLVAVLGFVFGKSDDGGSGMAPIKVALVDEDGGDVAEFLERVASSPEFEEYFDLSFRDREEALSLINDNDLSGVIVVPEGFANSYMEGTDETLVLELIKNPAQSVYPAMIEEGLEALVTGLNTLARTFKNDLKGWLDFLEDDDRTLFSDTLILAGLLQDTVDHFEAAREYLNPPLVGFQSEIRTEDQENEEDSSFSVFAWIYIGMAGMFMLMVSNAMNSDLYREARFRSLQRFNTLHEGMFVFVAEKMILTVVVTLIAAAIMFCGSALVFGFSWATPLPVALIVICYSICAAGLTAFIAVAAGKEKRADNMNTVIIMGFAILGGAMFEPKQLPSAIRDYITPYLPTNWFISVVRDLQFGDDGTAWASIALKLLITGLVLVAFSSFLFHRRLSKGGLG